MLPGVDSNTRFFILGVYVIFIIGDVFDSIVSKFDAAQESNIATGLRAQITAQLDGIYSQVGKVTESQELAGQALSTILQFIHNAQAAQQQR